MAVAVTATDDQFHAEVPKALFPVHLGALSASFSNTGHVYAVTKDGQRFLVNSGAQSGAAPLTVVLNWTSAIQK